MEANNLNKIHIPDRGIVIYSRIKRPKFADKPHAHNRANQKKSQTNAPRTIKKAPGYKICIAQLFNLTLLGVYRAKLEISKNANSLGQNNSNERVNSALKYISQNSHQQFSLSDAAKLAKVSQRQFTNICRTNTDKSFIKFLNQQRCKKAKDQVINTNMPITSIAFEVGYEDLSTFYRAFKNIYKTSPLAFREETNSK